MSRRGRAIGFVIAALAAAIAAAAIADGYGARVSRGYGALRPVVVTSAALAAGRPIVPARAARALETRQVPSRFVPSGALRDPAAAVGLAPTAAVPAGAYLLAGQLRAPRRRPAHRLRGGRRALQLSVGGAAALLLGAGDGAGRRVDVVVTTEPGAGGRGRTYVAATAVPLLALAPEPEAGVEGAAAATLAVTRTEALRLIAAQSFARQLTLLPAG